MSAYCIFFNKIKNYKITLSYGKPKMTIRRKTSPVRVLRVSDRNKNRGMQENIRDEYNLRSNSRNRLIIFFHNQKIYIIFIKF